MSRSAMTALLSVLAVAGFQNRDKIGEVLKGLAGNVRHPGDPNADPATGPAASEQAGGLGGLFGGAGGLGGLSDLIRGTTSGGGILSGGLGGILDQFNQTGHGETAKSWVQQGPNAEIDDRGLSEALGPEVLQDIAARTGLTPEEVLSRLSRDLPKAVDGLTPEGVLPTEDSDMADTERQTSVPSIKPTIV